MSISPAWDRACYFQQPHRAFTKTREIEREYSDASNRLMQGFHLQLGFIITWHFKGYLYL